MLSGPTSPLAGSSTTLALLHGSISLRQDLITIHKAMDILGQLGWYIQVNRQELVCRLERALSVLKLVILQRLVECVYKGVYE